MTVLEVSEPESYILIIILKIESTLAMLLVLHPLAFVLFAVRESIYAISIALTFLIRAFVGITIGIDCGTLALWLSAYHFSLVLTTITGDAGTQRNLLSKGRHRTETESQCKQHLLYVPPTESTRRRYQVDVIFNIFLIIFFFHIQ